MARHDWREAESPEEAVLLAARYETADEVREALENLGDGDPDGWIDQYVQTALHWAIRRMPEVVPDLLRAGADPNREDDDGVHPIEEAAASGNGAVFRAIVEAGGRVSVESRVFDDEDDRLMFRGTVGPRDLLIRAAEGGNAEIVETALAAGHSVDLVGPNLDTPLHRAANADVARILIARGADPSGTNLHRMTPLHFAAERGRADVCDILLRAGADPNLGNIHGKTPLHLAAKEGFGGACVALVDAGADPNMRDKYGGSPMEYAKSDSVRELVRAALERCELSRAIPMEQPCEPTEGQGRRRRI